MIQSRSFGYRRSLFQSDLARAASDAPSFGLSRRDVDDLRSTSMRDSMRYLQSRRDANSRMSTTDRVVGGLEVGAGAALIGVLTGRLGSANIPGTPIPMGLAAYAIGTAAAIFAPVGRAADHIQRVADGSLAGYLTAWGVGFGTKLRESAGQPVGPITSGTPHQLPSARQMPPGYGAHGAAPVGSPAHLTEAELVSVARRRVNR